MQTPHSDWVQFQLTSHPVEKSNYCFTPPDLYRNAIHQFPYGRDSNLQIADETYKIAGDYLSGEGLVEDWGAGTCWAKQYIKSPYLGIDGAWSRWSDKIVDLTSYKSSAPKILMRHVLEHNWEWRSILSNMLSSFQEKALLVLFLKPGEKDWNVYKNSYEPHKEIPGLSLCEKDLHEIIEKSGVEMTYEEISSNIESKYERVYYLSKS